MAFSPAISGTTARKGPKKRPNPLVRRHIQNCERCTMFRTQLKQTDKVLAALLPIGPLAVSDEVTLELQLKIIEQNVADGQFVKADWPRVLGVLRKMVLDLKRIGRRGGAG